MRILAIENTTARSSVALLDTAAGQPLFHGSYLSPRRQTGPLFSIAGEALDASGGNIDLIAAGVGPGSYNGIRAAVALVQGLSLATGVPCAGFSSLLALAGGSFLAAGNARGGQLFVAEVVDGSFAFGPALFPAGETGRFSGRPGKKFWVGEGAPDGGWETAFPCAVRLAKCAARAAEETGIAGLPPPSPLYLKPAHITSAPNKKN